MPLCVVLLSVLAALPWVQEAVQEQDEKPWELGGEIRTQHAGRICSTALAVLCLQAEYRYARILR